MSKPPSGSSITRVVVNARIRTGDLRRPWADACALAGDRVVAVGSSAEIRKLAPANATVDDVRGAEFNIREGRLDPPAP